MTQLSRLITYEAFATPKDVPTESASIRAYPVLTFELVQRILRFSLSPPDPDAVSLVLHLSSSCVDWIDTEDEFEAATLAGNYIIPASNTRIHLTRTHVQFVADQIGESHRDGDYLDMRTDSILISDLASDFGLGQWAVPKASVSRVVITTDGRAVNNVYADASVQVMVLDSNVESLDESETHLVDGERYFVLCEINDPSVSLVDRAFEQAAWASHEPLQHVNRQYVRST